MSTSASVESAEAKELSLVGKVELRIALADTDTKLESLLKTYLAPLLLKLASEHASVRNKVSRSLMAFRTNFPVSTWSRSLVDFFVRSFLFVSMSIQGSKHRKDILVYLSSFFKLLLPRLVVVLTTSDPVQLSFQLELCSNSSKSNRTL